MGRVRYDRESDAVYIKFDEGSYDASEEIEDDIILDFDRRGKLIGMEILNVKDKLKPEVLRKLIAS